MEIQEANEIKALNTNSTATQGNNEKNSQNENESNARKTIGNVTNDVCGTKILTKSEIISKNADITKDINDLVTHDTNISEGISKEVTQDTNITEEISKNIAQDANITEEISKNIAQDANITEEISKNVAQDANITKGNSKKVTQDPCIPEENKGTVTQDYNERKVQNAKSRNKDNFNNIYVESNTVAIQTTANDNNATTDDEKCTLASDIKYGIITYRDTFEEISHKSGTNNEFYTDNTIHEDKATKAKEVGFYNYQETSDVEINIDGETVTPDEIPCLELNKKDSKAEGTALNANKYSKTMKLKDSDNRIFKDVAVNTDDIADLNNTVKENVSFKQELSSLICLTIKTTLTTCLKHMNTKPNKKKRSCKKNIKFNPSSHTDDINNDILTDNRININKVLDNHTKNELEKYVPSDNKISDKDKILRALDDLIKDCEKRDRYSSRTNDEIEEQFGDKNDEIRRNNSLEIDKFSENDNECHKIEKVSEQASSINNLLKNDDIEKSLGAIPKRMIKDVKHKSDRAFQTQSECLNNDTKGDNQDATANNLSSNDKMGEKFGAIPKILTKNDENNNDKTIKSQTGKIEEQYNSLKYTKPSHQITNYRYTQFNLETMRIKKNVSNIQKSNQNNKIENLITLMNFVRNDKLTNKNEVVIFGTNGDEFGNLQFLDDYANKAYYNVLNLKYHSSQGVLDTANTSGGLLAASTSAAPPSALKKNTKKNYKKYKFGATGGETNTGTGLFGATNTSGGTQQQNTSGFGAKPAGVLDTANTSGGLLAASTSASSATGGETNTGTGLFGATNTSGGTQQQNTSGFGAKPAGVLDTANTSGGLLAASTSASSATGGETNTGTGLFGATNTSGGTQQQNTSGFGAKPAGVLDTANTSGGLLAASTSASSATGGETNTGTGLFGATNTSGGTQQQNTSGFGAKPAGLSSTATTGTTGGGLFGSSTPSTGLFGQTNNTMNTGGLFGANTSGLGQQQSGTGPGTYNPVVGTEEDENGVGQTINIIHRCITCMEEYESKSLEELRLEDYVAGRKPGGFQQNQTETTTVFGGTDDLSDELELDEDISIPEYCAKLAKKLNHYYYILKRIVKLKSVRDGIAAYLAYVGPLLRKILVWGNSPGSNDISTALNKCLHVFHSYDIYKIKSRGEHRLLNIKDRYKLEVCVFVRNHIGKYFIFRNKDLHNNMSGPVLFDTRIPDSCKPKTWKPRNNYILFEFAGIYNELPYFEINADFVAFKHKLYLHILANHFR